MKSVLMASAGAWALVFGVALVAPPAMAQESASAGVQAGLAVFTPRPDARTTRIDYSIWTEALDLIVFRMGRSIRESAPSVDPGTGTRRVYGHDSRYRLEGNRVAFSFLEPDVIASFTTYREDLEAMADQIDITKLGRNEQLAFWINLHNVTVIEQIARAYPVGQPSRMKIGPEESPVDLAKTITIRGVKLSPHDIRTRIVYPNWKDPKVIYGFFRGEIGGPSIQDEAFTADNVSGLLERSATEFVNSLRGTQKRGSTLDVSDIYAEARPFYFTDWPNAIRSHLEEFANTEVLELMGKTRDVDARIYERDIADLANGERDPNVNPVAMLAPDGTQIPESVKIPRNIMRLIVEREEKTQKILKRGERVGIVTFIGIELPDEETSTKEVE